MMQVRCASLFSPECTRSVSSSISGGSENQLKKKYKEKRGKNACLTNDIVFDVVETLDVDRQDWKIEIQ